MCSSLLPLLPGISVGSRHNLITFVALLGGIFHRDRRQLLLKRHHSLMSVRHGP